MIVLSGAELVLPDRILSPGALVIDGALHGHYIVPGLIDLHVHGSVVQTYVGGQLAYSRNTGAAASV